MRNLFYIQPGDLTDTGFTLKGQEAVHAVKVLRYRSGEAVEATDGQGRVIRGTIISAGRDLVEVRIEEQRRIPRITPDVTLAIGSVKKRDRMEFAVEKCTELGARRIVIFTGEHSEKARHRLDRLEMTALSAMKQSLRCWKPEIVQCGSIEEVLDRFDEGHILVADETAGSGSVSIPGLSGSWPILVLIGPEGGFSNAERAVLEKREITAFTLGEYRLRTETAAVMVMGLLENLKRFGRDPGGLDSAFDEM